MLPISRVTVGKDYMEFFTTVVWATVILIMFLAKLKVVQDFYVAAIIISVMIIVNADLLFRGFHWYKVFMVLRSSLRKDCGCTVLLAFACLAAHGTWPESVWPGVALHFGSFVVWFFSGKQTSPLVTCGLWAGGKNQMTKVQLMLRVAAQFLGCVIAFAAFGLWYSFRVPGQGPFKHLLSPQSAVGAAVTILGSVVVIKNRDASVEMSLRQAEAQKSR